MVFQARSRSHGKRTPVSSLGGIGLWEPLVHPGLNLLPQLARIEVVLGRAGCATWSIEVLCAMIFSWWSRLGTTGLVSNASFLHSVSNPTDFFTSPFFKVHLRIQPHPLTDSPASWIYSAVALVHARLGRCSAGYGLGGDFLSGRWCCDHSSDLLAIISLSGTWPVDKQVGACW